jgi:hypothetical protein
MHRPNSALASVLGVLAISILVAVAAEAPAKTAPPDAPREVAPAAGASGPAASAPAASTPVASASSLPAVGMGAADPGAIAPGTQPAGRDAASMSRRPLTPMHAEIQAALEEEAAAIAALEARFRAEQDPAAALAIQVSIQHTKVDGQLRVLGIQANYARQEGRTQMADELEAAIRQITSSTRSGTPVERAAPSDPGASSNANH